jgi:O-antigen biosynthesis protein
MIERPSSKRYTPSYIDVNNETNSLSIMANLIGENKRVLEIGTSTGYFTKILMERGNSVIGIEIDQEAAEIAGKYCELMIVGDIEEIDLNLHLEASSFDVIVFGDVLEHLRYPEATLMKIGKYLKPNAYIVVSLPNFCHGDIILNLLYGDFKYTPIGLLDETHLRFFGYKNIINLFNKCGYDIENIEKTTAAVGWTEQKRDLTDVPSPVLKFIISLPNSDTYQFVFKAFRCEKAASPDIPDVSLNQLFESSIQEFIKGRIDPLKQQLNESYDRINKLDQELQENNTKINSKENEIETTKGILKAKNFQINLMIQKEDHMSEELAKVSAELAKVSAELGNVSEELANINRSVIWRSVKRYQHVVDEFCPHNTYRRKVHDGSIHVVRIAYNEGIRSLYAKTLNFCRIKKNRRKNIDMYSEWIKKNEPSNNELSIQSNVSDFKYLPKISIITPVWNTDRKYLSAAINSILNQTYNNWELCIVDGHSTKLHVRDLLKHYAEKDKRIKVVFLNENKGIAGNSNEALSLATGEFIGLMDHDDELAPFALAEIVKLLNQMPYLDFIYSDEDKIDMTGKRYDPFFKPEWSPDLLLACGYTNHFSVYRKAVVEKIGSFRMEFDGSQDYDLLLRFTEFIDNKNIAHISKILYHWRQIPGSTSIDPYAKNGVVINAAKKALNDTIKRRGIVGTVEDGLWPSSYHIKRTIIGNPKVSIIIPTKDNLQLLKNCISSIEETSTYKNYEIIIVDNDSVEPETIDYLSKIPLKVIHFNEKFNFSRINNFASGYATGEFLIFLNNDTEIITPNWIEALLEQAQIPEVGAVGCKLLYSDGSIQHAGVVLGMSPDRTTGVAGHIFNRFSYEDNGYFGSINVIKNYSAVTAAAMMVRKKIFEDAKGFDEKLAVCYNDVDLCLRLQEMGYRIIYTPYAELFHLESVSRGCSVDINEANYMLKRWDNLIKNDPFFNKNLTLTKYDCEINIQ